MRRDGLQGGLCRSWPPSAGPNAYDSVRPGIFRSLTRFGDVGHGGLGEW
jgi:hypothetical protein